MPARKPAPPAPVQSVRRLNEESVIQAAIKVLRRRGVDGFNMRALAEQLGVTPGAAYRHVGGKEAVLARAAERVVADIPTHNDPALPWQEGILSTAKSYRRLCARYPGLAGYLVQHMHDNLANRRLFLLSAQWMQQAGLKEKDFEQTARVLNAFVGASVGAPSASEGVRLGRPARETPDRPSAGLSDEDFEYGLRLIMSGLERQVPPDSQLRTSRPKASKPKPIQSLNR